MKLDINFAKFAMNSMKFAINSLEFSLIFVEFPINNLITMFQSSKTLGGWHKTQSL